MATPTGRLHVKHTEFSTILDGCLPFWKPLSILLACWKTSISVTVPWVEVPQSSFPGSAMNSFYYSTVGFLYQWLANVFHQSFYFEAILSIIQHSIAQKNLSVLSKAMLGKLFSLLHRKWLLNLLRELWAKGFENHYSNILYWKSTKGKEDSQTSSHPTAQVSNINKS